jgi:hypothetical protein
MRYVTVVTKASFGALRIGNVPRRELDFPVMASTPKHPPGPLKSVRMTMEECRSQAQKCIDESRKTQSSPKLSAAWIALAEEWVAMAEQASLTKHDESL